MGTRLLDFGLVDFLCPQVSPWVNCSESIIMFDTKSHSDLAIYLLPNGGASREGVKNKIQTLNKKNKRRDIGSVISRLELLEARILTNLNAVVFSFPISFHKFSKTEAGKSTVKPQKQCSRNAKVLGFFSFSG